MSDRCPGCSGWGAHTDLCTIDTLKAKVAALEKDGCCCDADQHVCAQAEKLEKDLGRARKFIDTALRFEDCMDHHSDDPQCQSDMREIYDEAKKEYLAAPEAT